MTLEINGETRSMPVVPNVQKLLGHLGVGETRVAFKVNRRIIRRNDWDSTLAVRAGRPAFRSGRIPRKLYASASSPVEGISR